MSKVLSVYPKLVEVLQCYRPRNLGPLWRTKFVAYPDREAGYYKLVCNVGGTDSQSLATAFIDPAGSPPIHLYYDMEGGTLSPQDILIEALALASKYRDNFQSVATPPTTEEEAAFRLLNGRYDRCPGLSIDIFGRHSVIGVHSTFWNQHLKQVKNYLKSSSYRFETIRFVDNTAKGGRSYATKMLWGPSAVKNTEIIENGCKLLIQLTNGLSTGLYLDQRENRRYVAGLCPPNSSLLNLFAYTCSFGLIAAKLNQYITTNIDISEKFLNIGKLNYAKNNLDLNRHTFLRTDVIHFLKWAKERNATYDIVVCDPPTLFNAGGGVGLEAKKVLSCKKHYDVIAFHCCNVVRPGGYLVLFCNSVSVRKEKWRAMVEQGLKNAFFSVIEEQQNGTGCQNDVRNDRSMKTMKFIRYLYASEDFREDLDDPALKGACYQRI